MLNCFSMKNWVVDRRAFLKCTAGAAISALGLPYFIASSALGKAGFVAPSNRITVGCIGLGNQGSALMRGFLGKPDVQVVAVCDVHSIKLQGSREVIEKHYARSRSSGNYKGCSSYNDFREFVYRSDIDAVTVAPPDHWHAPISLAAIRTGKDIYLEKPIGVSPGQAWALREAVRRYGTVFQFGTQQRSDARFRQACELVRNGRLGKLHTINVWSPSSNSGGSTTPAPVPPELDYEMWLGPAPSAPYTKDRCSNVNPYFTSPFKIWPFIRDYCIGWIAGWGVHPLDIALWGAGHQLRGIVEVEGKGLFPTAGACDTATNWNVTLNYPEGGVKIDFRGTGSSNGLAPAEWRQRYAKAGGHGTVFEGTEGWIHVRRGHIDAHPKSLLQSQVSPDDIRLYNSNDHLGNFLHCVKSRARTISDIDAAVRVDTVCHLSDIATRLERKLIWDPKRERFVNNETANRLLVRAMRSPWHL
ncbi:MAG: Gfo/Idh/MocA family oxidoreductase [Phycisphaerales bacterium]|nr:MAG: Gfo/Idh/MocA family oxidoreductase [Phycisphaerales bacterium]